MQWKDSALAINNKKRPLESVVAVALLTPPIPIAVKTAWKEEEKKRENRRD